MEFDRRTQYSSTGAAVAPELPVPGKRTLTQDMVQRHPADTSYAPPTGAAAARRPQLPEPSGPRPSLQMLFRRRGQASDPEQVHAAAARGTATVATQLPHLEQIQRSFGKHDVSGVQAHVGSEAAASAQEMGAQAFATGNHVVLGAGTDLHTVAHEAAHVVQQRAGVHLKGGVGEVGDTYERHADQVADAVVAGRSAENLLDEYAGPQSRTSPSHEGVQCYTKRGNVRISDNCNMAVVDEGHHHRAFVTPAVLKAGRDGLHAESKIVLEAGGLVALSQLRLGPQQLNNTCVEVTVKQKTNDQTDRQKNGAKELSQELHTEASVVREPRFVDRVLRRKFQKLEEAQILSNVRIMKALALTYKRLSKKNDFSPAHVAKVARACWVPRKIILFLMEQTEAYHQRVINEYEQGGFTTPNDCGETAKIFVLGSEVNYYKLPPAEVKAKGYNYHVFSMLFHDGEDRISLENAVGGNRLEQLWKQGIFDADWYWAMRGTRRPDNELTTDADEKHGIGEPATLPTPGYQQRRYDERLKMQREWAERNNPSPSGRGDALDATTTPQSEARYVTPSSTTSFRRSHRGG